jgi:hypothetical protein
VVGPHPRLDTPGNSLAELRMKLSSAATWVKAASRGSSTPEEATMPLTQGGPPGWVWGRASGPLNWEIAASTTPEGQPAYGLRVGCGQESVRLRPFTAEEVKHLAALLTRHGPQR